MFDPLAAKKVDQAHLSATQSFYVNQHFAAYIERAMIKSQILEQIPVPTHDRLVVPKVDEAFLDMVTGRAYLVKPADKAFAFVQGRCLDVMCPLSELWKNLHKYKKKGSGSFDLDTMLDLTLKSVLLVGQTQVAANFHRGISVRQRIYSNKMRPTGQLAPLCLGRHSIRDW